MSHWIKRVELATNIAVLCAFLLVAGLAVRRLREPSPITHDGPSPGEKVSLRGIDWSKSDQNLVLALSTGCHFCSESAGFYKRLVPSANGSGVRVLAILPQSLADSHTYLQKLGLSVQEVVQGSLAELEVSGTPTLLLVDRQGRVQKAWVGKLGKEEELQVLASLR